jgi:hypothetical protein
MLGPDQTTPILAQLPVSSSIAESEVASDFDNEIDKSKGYRHSPGRVGSPPDPPMSQPYHGLLLLRVFQSKQRQRRVAKYQSDCTTPSSCLKK